MKVICPQCNSEYEVDDSMRGQTFSCTQEGCTGILVVPGNKNIFNTNFESFAILDKMKSAFQKQIKILIFSAIALCLVILFVWAQIKTGSDYLHATSKKLSLYETYKEIDFSMIPSQQECERLHEGHNYLQKEYEKAKSHLKKQKQGYTKAEKKCKESEVALSEAQTKLKNAEKKLSTTRKELKTATTEKESLSEQYQNKIAEKDELHETLLRIRARKKQYEAEQSSLEDKKSNLPSKQEKAKKNLDIASKMLATLPSEAQIEAAREKYVAAKAAAKPASQKRIVSVGATPMSHKSNYDEKAQKKEQAAWLEYENLKRTREKGEEEFLYAKRICETLEAQYIRLNKKLQEIQESLKNIAAYEAETQRKHDQSAKDLEQIKKQLEASGLSFPEWQNEYRELEADLRKYNNLVAQAAFQNEESEQELNCIKAQKERAEEECKVLEKEVQQCAQKHKEAVQKHDSLETNRKNTYKEFEIACKESDKLHNRQKTFRVLFYISLTSLMILLLLFVIYHLIFIYQGWRIIPRETAVTTPKKAIWLNFVPGLFPFWQWVTYFELGKAYSDLSGRRANKVFALIVSVMNFLGVWMISLPWIAIILVMQGELLRSAEIIINNQNEEE